MFRKNKKNTVSPKKDDTDINNLDAEEIIIRFGTQDQRESITAMDRDEIAQLASVLKLAAMGQLQPAASSTSAQFTYAMEKVSQQVKGGNTEYAKPLIHSPDSEYVATRVYTSQRVNDNNTEYGSMPSVSSAGNGYGVIPTGNKPTYPLSEVNIGYELIPMLAPDPQLDTVNIPKLGSVDLIYASTTAIINGAPTPDTSGEGFEEFKVQQLGVTDEVIE